MGVNKKIVGLYRITSPSGKVYIGQSWDVKTRWYNHGKANHTPHLFNSIKKYGKESHVFEMLHEFPLDVSQSVLDEYEIFSINQYIAAGVKVLNVKEGGSRGKLTPETIEKIRQKNIGRVVWWAHKIGRKGRKHTQETKDKMSESRKGIRPSEKTIAKARGNTYRRGVKLSEDQKEVIRTNTKKQWEEKRKKGQNGRIISDEGALQVRERIMKGETNLSVLAKEFGVSLSTICGIVKIRTFNHIFLEGYEPFSKINFTKVGGDKYRVKKGQLTELSKKKLSDSLMKSDKVIRGENHSSAKLTKDDIFKIWLLHLEGRSARSIAKVYVVSHSSILNILKFKKWRKESEQFKINQQVNNGAAKSI